MQAGYDLITISQGNAHLDTKTNAGFLYSQLEYETLAYSLAFTNAGCAFFSFVSNYSTVDAYLTLESDLEETLDSKVCSPVQQRPAPSIEGAAHSSNP